MQVLSTFWWKLFNYDMLDESSKRSQLFHDEKMPKQFSVPSKELTKDFLGFEKALIVSRQPLDIFSVSEKGKLINLEQSFIKVFCWFCVVSFFVWIIFYRKQKLSLRFNFFYQAWKLIEFTQIETLKLRTFHQQSVLIRDEMRTMLTININKSQGTTNIWQGRPKLSFQIIKIAAQKKFLRANILLTIFDGK